MVDHFTRSILHATQSWHTNSIPSETQYPSLCMDCTMKSLALATLLDYASTSFKCCFKMFYIYRPLRQIPFDSASFLCCLPLNCPELFCQLLLVLEDLPPTPTGLSTSFPSCLTNLLTSFSLKGFCDWLQLTHKRANFVLHGSTLINVFPFLNLSELSW